MVVALLCALIAIVQIAVPEVVGVANNGDFFRVMHPNRILFIDGDPQLAGPFMPQYVMIFFALIGCVVACVDFLRLNPAKFINSD